MKKGLVNVTAKVRDQVRGQVIEGMYMQASTDVSWEVKDDIRRQIRQRVNGQAYTQVLRRVNEQAYDHMLRRVIGLTIP
jgi:hypothetical protein